MGDLISRNALKKRIENLYRCDWDEIKKCVFFAEVIDDLPSVEPENEPLTWDELKTMQGKPVWVEWILDEDYDLDSGGSNYQEWLFVYSWRGKDKQILIATDSEGRWHEFYKERQDTEWRAYRKERE